MIQEKDDFYDIYEAKNKLSDFERLSTCKSDLINIDEHLSKLIESSPLKEREKKGNRSKDITMGIEF